MALLFAGEARGEKNLPWESGSPFDSTNRLRRRCATGVERPPFESGSFIASDYCKRPLPEDDVEIWGNDSLLLADPGSGVATIN
jgi:hypothetical protein